MGNVIDFPVEQRLLARPVSADAGTGRVIILPVVRVERAPVVPSDGIEPGSGTAPGRKRRRRRA
jgi:hypothetical protein